MTWDYTKENYEKQAEADLLWRLERFCNYGTPPMKINRAELKKYLPLLHISEETRAFLSLLI